MIPKAQVYKAGAMVVKTNINRALVMNPEHVLRRIVLPLRTDIGDVQERCRLFLNAALTGWKSWLKNMISKGTSLKIKQDLIAKVLGGVGTGLGIEMH